MARELQLAAPAPGTLVLRQDADADIPGRTPDRTGETHGILTKTTSHNTGTPTIKRNPS